MSFWDRNKHIVVELLVVGLVALAAYATVIRWSKRAAGRLSAKMKEMDPDKSAFFGGGLEMKKLDVRYDGAVAQLKAETEKLKEALEVYLPPIYKLPGNIDDNDAGLEWIRRYDGMRDDMERRCLSSGITMAPGAEKFGFAREEKVPNAKLARTQLLKLAVVEKMVELFIAAKQEAASERLRILRIVPGEPTLTGAEKEEPFIREYPIEFGLHSSLDVLMSFLHKVRARNQFLVIRSVSIDAPSAEIAGLGAGLLQVNVSASCMSFLSEEEIAAGAASHKVKVPIKLPEPPGY